MLRSSVRETTETVNSRVAHQDKTSLNRLYHNYSICYNVERRIYVYLGLLWAKVRGTDDLVNPKRHTYGTKRLVLTTEPPVALLAGL